MLDTFYLYIKFFFQYYFNKLIFQLPQNVKWADEITRVISAHTGINGVSLAHHTSFARMATYIFFIVFFETVLGREQSR